MVPIRAVSEALGANVGWDGTTKTVVVSLDDTVVTFSVGNTKAKRNGDEVTMQVPAQIIDGRTMVPLRFVSESLGALVGWDGTTRTVSITSAAKVARIENVVGTAAEIQRGTWEVWKWAAVSTLKDDEKYLVEGGKLRTGANTTAELVLSDGSRIMLDPDSVIVITALTQDRTTRVRQSAFEVTRGSASVNVVKQVPTGSVFKIKVDGEEYVVRGTQFKVGKGKPLVVASGLVQATPKGETTSVYVPSGKVYDPSAATSTEKVKAMSDEEQKSLETRKDFFVASMEDAAERARKSKEALKNVVSTLPSDERNNQLKKKAMEEFTRAQEKEATIQTDNNQAVSTMKATLSPQVMQAMINGQGADAKFMADMPKDPNAAGIIDDATKNKFMTMQSDMMAKIRQTTEAAAQGNIIAADAAQGLANGAALVQSDALKVQPPSGMTLTKEGWVPPADWKNPKGKPPEGFTPPQGYVPPSGYDWSKLGDVKPGEVPAGWTKAEDAGWTNANTNLTRPAWFNPSAPMMPGGGFPGGMTPPSGTMPGGQMPPGGFPTGTFPGGGTTGGTFPGGGATGGTFPGGMPGGTMPPAGTFPGGGTPAPFSPPADWKPPEGYTPPPGWSPPLGWNPKSGEVPPGWEKAEEYGILGGPQQYKVFGTDPNTGAQTTTYEAPPGWRPPSDGWKPPADWTPQPGAPPPGWVEAPATGSTPPVGMPAGTFPGGGSTGGGTTGGTFPGGMPGGTMPPTGTFPGGGTTGGTFPGGGMPGGATPPGGMMPPGGTMPPGGPMPPTGTFPPGVTPPTSGSGTTTISYPPGTGPNTPSIPTALPGGGFTLPAGWYVGDGGAIFSSSGAATDYSVDTLVPNGGISGPGGMPSGTGMPGTGIPGTGMPGTGLPATGTPGTGLPGTGTPGTGMPGTGMPGTGMPGTGTPGTGLSGTGMPGTGLPGTGTPETGMPGTGMPGTGMPGTGMPGTGSPGTGTPGTELPGTGTPGTGMPGTGTLGTGPQPPMEQPPMQQPPF